MFSKADFKVDLLLSIIYLFIFIIIMVELLIFGIIMIIPHDQISDGLIINVVDDIIDWVVR